MSKINYLLAPLLVSFSFLHSQKNRIADSPTSTHSPSPPLSDPYDLAARRYKAMMAARKARARRAESCKKDKEDELMKTGNMEKKD